MLKKAFKWSFDHSGTSPHPPIIFRLYENHGWSIENIPGEVIIVPTYLPHYTDTTLSKNPGISVAFDVYDRKDLAEPTFIDWGTCILHTPLEKIRV